MFHATTVARHVTATVMAEATRPSAAYARASGTSFEAGADSVARRTNRVSSNAAARGMTVAIVSTNANQPIDRR
jgi:hypothetical protein